MCRTSGTSERRNEWCLRARSLKRRPALELECLLLWLSEDGGGGRGGKTVLLLLPLLVGCCGSASGCDVGVGDGDELMSGSG